MFLDFLSTQIYLVFVIIILSISEILKSNNNFSETLLSILSINSKISKKWSFSFIVIILGMLPIPGRIVLVNFLLDSVIDKENIKSERIGFLSYLATHHYYLWSPIETSIIISMGILKISYKQMLIYTFYPLLSYIIFFFFYLIFFMKEDNFKKVEFNCKIDCKNLIDIAIISISVIVSMLFSNEKIMSMIFLFVFVFLSIKHKINLKNIFLNLDYKFISSIFIILCIGFLIKNSTYLKHILELLTISKLDIIIIFLVCFVLSFIFGSSSRYATIAANMTLLLGMPYFSLLYIVDYCGYILSPVHKCTFYIFSYFKYNMKFILLLIILCLVVFIPSYLDFIFKL